MSRALRLLIGLQLIGWLRYLVNSLRTVKGAILALVGLIVFLPWILSLLMHPRDVRGFGPDDLLRHGPLALLAYCLANVLLTSGERAVYFSPAEVNFLFPGPFGRRELLAYKVASTILIALPMTLLMACLLYVHARWFVGAYVGVFLMMVFLHLFTMAVNLLAISVGQQFYRRGRAVVIGAIVLVALATLIPLAAGRDTDFGRLLRDFEDSPTGWALTSPVRPFFDAFLAANWSELALPLLFGVVVNLALFLLVVGLDAHYLEAATATSERVYAQLQRLRSGEMPAGLGRREGQPVRLGVPTFPRWGGAGPIFWRQTTTALRGSGRLVLLLVVFLTFMLAPVMAIARQAPESMAVGPMLGIMVLVATSLVTTLVPFDFRGDVDRIEVLKSLPIPSWCIAVGQLLTPVVLLTTVQWVALAVIQLVALPEPDPMLLGFAAFALAGNWVLFALENLLFLLFPTRVLAGSPGDFQALGRNVLFLMAKLLGLSAVAMAAASVGLIVWLLTGMNTPVAVAAAWPVVLLCGVALVPLVAFAFDRFDVSRDTPP